jgi:alpha-L-rhamnosidase
MILLVVMVITFPAVAEKSSLRSDLTDQPGIVGAQFLYMQADFPSCHASTIEETQDYLVASYFGGSDEGNEDVCIYVSRKKKGAAKWDPPVKVADGIQYTSAETSEPMRYPCWNPVLYQADNGRLYLFYKVGPNPDQWWGMLKVSRDQGKSWARTRRLPQHITGPVRAKPVKLPDGRLLCGSSTEDKGWRVHMEWTSDMGRTWSRTKALNDGKEFAGIQPTILTYPDGRIQILCRSDDNIRSSWSKDGGKTWGPLEKSILPNPSAGIDAVRLKDNRHLLVYNHSTRKTGARSQLNVAVTADGISWKAALKLEDGTTIEDKKAYGAYPAAILGSDGLVHIVYTWKRDRINYVAVDPAKLVLRDMPGGKWPK